MRVHADHEQIFDDAMDQKATVSEEIYSYCSFVVIAFVIYSAGLLLP